jgi:hypothetical protein
MSSGQRRELCSTENTQGAANDAVGHGIRRAGDDQLTGVFDAAGATAPRKSLEQPDPITDRMSMATAARGLSASMCRRSRRGPLAPIRTIRASRVILGACEVPSAPLGEVCLDGVMWNSRTGILQRLLHLGPEPCVVRGRVGRQGAAARPRWRSASAGCARHRRRSAQCCPRRRTRVPWGRGRCGFEPRQLQPWLARVGFCQATDRPGLSMRLDFSARHVARTALGPSRLAAASNALAAIAGIPALLLGPGRDSTA